MIPLIIDTRPLIERYALSETQVELLIDSSVKYIVGKFAEYWELEAMKNLHQSRTSYLSNLKVVDEGRMKGAVVLDYTQNPMVRFIEEGVGAFDMKAGFEKSSKIKHTKSGGWYLTIPFKKANPEAVGESTVFSGVMPLEIYKVVKNADKPLQIVDIPNKYKVQTSRPSITNLSAKKTFDEYVHKSNIYEGLGKRKDFDGKTSYMSFRRVSSNSDGNAWIHPGINAYNLAQKALNTLETHFQEEMGKAIDSSLIELGVE